MSLAATRKQVLARPRDMFVHGGVELFSIGPGYVIAETPLGLKRSTFLARAPEHSEKAIKTWLGIRAGFSSKDAIIDVARRITDRTVLSDGVIEELEVVELTQNWALAAAMVDVFPADVVWRLGFAPSIELGVRPCGVAWRNGFVLGAIAPRRR